jgi:hypothetical protein
VTLGGEGVFRVCVRNIGHATVPAPWYNELVFSNDAVVDDDDTRLAAVTFLHDLEPAGVACLNVTARFTRALVGTAYVLNHVDVRTSIPGRRRETPTTLASANASMLVTVVTPPRADLSLVSISTPAADGFAYEARDLFLINATYSNVGDARYCGSVCFTMYASADGALDATDFLLSEECVSGNSCIAAGETLTNTLQITLPEMRAGSHRVFVVVGTRRRVRSEDNQANNQLEMDTLLQVNVPYITSTPTHVLLSPGQRFVGRAVVIGGSGFAVNVMSNVERHEAFNSVRGYDPTCCQSFVCLCMCL